MPTKYIVYVLFSDWQSFFTKKLESWEQMHLHWVQHFKGELLIVYYDDLIADVEGILRSILKFINFPIDEVCILVGHRRGNKTR